MSYDVFLSHNGKQKPWVRRLYQSLRSCGLNVFFDEESIEVAANIANAVPEALRNSRHVLIIISPGAALSRWVNAEVSETIMRDPDNSEGRIIPVLLEPTPEQDIRWLGSFVNRVDFTDLERRDHHFRRLVRHLCRHYARKRIPAPPPWPDQMTGPHPRVVSLESGSILETASRDELRAWGWSSHRITHSAMKLDFAVLPGLTDEDEGPAREWEEIDKRYPDTYRYLVEDRRRLIGYWQILPAFPEDFELLCQGQFTADQFSLARVPKLIAGDVDIYFMNLGALPEYQRSTTPLAFPMLLRSFAEVATMLARQDIRFRRICANAFSDDGVALCRSFYLTRTHPAHHQGEMFAGEFRTVLRHPAFQRYPELLQSYGVPVMAPTPESAGKMEHGDSFPACF